MNTPEIKTMMVCIALTIISFMCAFLVFLVSSISRKRLKLRTAATYCQAPVILIQLFVLLFLALSIQTAYNQNNITTCSLYSITILLSIISVGLSMNNLWDLFTPSTKKSIKDGVKNIARVIHLEKQVKFVADKMKAFHKLYDNIVKALSDFFNNLRS